MRTLGVCVALFWAVGASAFVLNPSVGLGVSGRGGVLLQQSKIARSQRLTRDPRGLSMTTQSPRRPDRNSGKSGEPDERGGRAMKNMLSEAAVASVVFYWLEFRDDLHPQWLKAFTRSIGEIQDIGWREHLYQLMRAQPEEILVRRLAQRPRGGSGNNPYLEPTRTAMEYTVVIQPQGIAKKIMQVREQISLEWIKDLELVAAENYELERHREDAIGLDQEDAERDRKMVFDHDPFNNSNTPYRGKNYKLLLEVITKAAIRAYRSELRIVGDRFTLNWVERFMHKNDKEGGQHLKGNELLEAVLDGPIVMIRDPRTEKNRVIDPGHIGRQIMAFRNVEAKRVIKMMSSVPDDHSTLNREFLEERLEDQVEDVVLTQRRRRIVEAMSPKDDIFPSADSSDQQGDWDTM